MNTTTTTVSEQIHDPALVARLDKEDTRSHTLEDPRTVVNRSRPDKGEKKRVPWKTVMGADPDV